MTNLKLQTVQEKGCTLYINVRVNVKAEKKRIVNRRSWLFWVVTKLRFHMTSYWFSSISLVGKKEMYFKGLTETRKPMQSFIFQKILGIKFV